jgi:hypothetical protein
VGKSAELNIILVDLFRALMEGRITFVFHRVKGLLYRYSCPEVEGVKSIACEQIGGAGKSLERLTDYLSDKGFEDMPWNEPSAVLVLELDEEEKSPKMTIPTLLAISSRDVMEELKNWWKSDTLEVSIRPPHTHVELLVLATAQFQSSDKPQFLSNLGLPSTTNSVGDVHQVVKKRMEIIGPLARQVLRSEKGFNNWKTAMELVSGVGEFLDMKESADKFKLPGTAKYYVAPDEHGKLLFLSNHAKELVLKSAKEEYRYRVAQLDFAWQAAEYIVKKFCVLNVAKNGTAVHEAWNYNNWEYPITQRRTSRWKRSTKWTSRREQKSSRRSPSTRTRLYLMALCRA